MTIVLVLLGVAIGIFAGQYQANRSFTLLYAEKNKIAEKKDEKIDQQDEKIASLYSELLELSKTQQLEISQAFYDGTRIQFGEKPEGKEDKEGFVVDFNQIEEAMAHAVEEEEVEYVERIDGVYR